MTDMDAILDEALDELDDESNESLGDEVSVPSPQTKLKAIGSKSSGDCVTVKIEGSAEIELNEESPAHTFQTVLRDFSEAAAIDNDVDEQIKIFVNQITIQKNASGIVPPSISTSKEGEVEKDLANLLEEMAKASLGEPSNGQTDDFLREMLGLQDEGGGDLNSDGVLDGMMEQLLSKDLMYEPMKQVTEKFPAWLETNKSLLSAKDYQKRSKQYECFKSLIHVYENNPGSIEKLLELMQQIQEFGQPPPEIIRDIAPELELDEDGMPKVNPMMSLGGDEECAIM